MDHAFVTILDKIQQRLIAAGTSMADRVFLDRTDAITKDDVSGCCIGILEVGAPQLDGIGDHDRREQYRVTIAVSPIVLLNRDAIRGLWNLIAEIKAALNGIDAELGAISWEPAGFSQAQKIESDRGKFAFLDILFHAHVALDEGDHTTMI